MPYATMKHLFEVAHWDKDRVNLAEVHMVAAGASVSYDATSGTVAIESGVGKTFTASDGQWFVRYIGGHLQVLTDEEFHQRFSLTPGTVSSR